MVVRIEDRALADWSRDDVTAMAEIVSACERRSLPEHPPTPVEEHRDWPYLMAATHDVWNAVATDDGAVVGFGVVLASRSADNPTHGGVEVFVHPDRRREGIATGLLRPLAAWARTAGRTLLNIDATTLDDGHHMLTAMGAERRYVDHRNVLWLDRIPPGLLEDWLARAPERAAGYELIAIDAPTPDEWVEPYCALLDVMNTAPRDDLDWDDEHTTPEEFRAIEARMLEQGRARWTLAAIETASGALAGFTELEWPAHAVDVVDQGNTGVMPAHRDRGLGRWLKAAMVERLRAERPLVNRIETWNAGTNEPMLAINHQMGFTLLEEIGTWQIPLETVEAWLARH